MFITVFFFFFFFFVAQLLVSFASRSSAVGPKVGLSSRHVQQIDVLADEKREVKALFQTLDKTCTRYKMEISA